MIIIRNNIIPFKGFTAINILGILFVRKNAVIDDVTINHESIHAEQMKEMLYVFFYVWYLIEWIIRLFMKGNAYRNISFEKESYENQNNLSYTNKRKRYYWFKYIKKRRKPTH